MVEGNEKAGLVAGEFRSWQSYWQFSHAIRRYLRYLQTPETEHFLQTVLATSKHRHVPIPANSIFWRAQLGHSWRRFDEDVDDEIRCAYPKDRMKPLAGRGWDSRANPRGIPCLYLGTTKETAMSEVRPWVGSFVSAGQFQVRRDLTVIDLGRGSKRRTNLFFEEPDAETRKKEVWDDIDRAFAEPMTRTDDEADYAPTQILAELFKREGFDGVVYRSNFGEKGFNIALFDPDDANLINCGLFEVKEITPTFKEADNFYYVQKSEENTIQQEEKPE